MNLLTRLRELSGTVPASPWTYDHCYVKAIYDTIPVNLTHSSSFYIAELTALMRNNIDKILDVVEAAQEVALCGFENVHNRKLKDALAELDGEQK